MGSLSYWHASINLPIDALQYQQASATSCSRVEGVCGSRRTLRSEELSRDVEGLAAHDNDLLAVEQLLRDRAGQTAEQMALSVDAITCQLEFLVVDGCEVAIRICATTRPTIASSGELTFP
jgi:hypothetical protein